MDISFVNAKPGEAAARWNELEAELASLRRESAERHPGRRLFPIRIRFPDEAAYLVFIGKMSEAEHFRADFERITSCFPELRSWAAAKPDAEVERSGDWPRLVAALSSVSCLARRRMDYWGDIDSHGLRILGAFRSAFPLAESILMDEETFDRFEGGRGPVKPRFFAIPQRPRG